MKNPKNTKNKVKALFITYGDFGHSSSRIRALQYFSLFESEMNFQINWIPRARKLHHSSFLYKIAIFPIIKRIQTLQRYFQITFCTYDIVYVQKFFLETSLVKKLKKKKTHLVYDFDDAIYIGNGATNNKYKADRMIQNADLVIVSSPVLEEYCLSLNRSINVIVAYTPTETERFPETKTISDQPVKIVWTGSQHTTPYLQNIRNALIKLGQLRKFSFTTIGADHATFANVNHQNIPWSEQNETNALKLADIGIMPLPDDDFAKGKGGYKLYLYMAAGLPIVASPVGINSQIIQHGENGFLAQSEEEWIKYLCILIDDQELRKTMGQKGRKLAEEKYDRKVIFEIIKNAVQKILE